MKHSYCDYCGFAAGVYHGTIDGKLMCIECHNKFTLNKEKYPSVGDFPHGKGETEPEVDSEAVPNPAGQLKLF